MIEFDDAALEEMIEDWEEQALEDLVDQLDRIGLECVNNARERGSYTDRSGNLRNSIASAVVVDGQIVRSNFFVGEGKAQAHQFIQELANENDEGIVLLLVAGMNYAAYVEFGHSDGSTRPYNVIASAEDLADSLVEELINQIKNEGITTD
ncbi:MAG: hypothetical protein ACRC9P_04870 [Bacteroides sp.]